MNTAPIDLKQAASQPVVDLLERALADAKRGRVLSIAVVAVLAPGNVTFVNTPGFPFEKHFGVDLLRRQLIEEAQRASSKQILRAPAAQL
jgi:hypothetical protein